MATTDYPLDAAHFELLETIVPFVLSKVDRVAFGLLSTAQLLRAKMQLGVDDVPCGGDSFFRQLDFMIATVANERFRKLYATDDVAAYAQL